MNDNTHINRRDRLRKKRQQRHKHMQMLQQVLRSSSDSGGPGTKGGPADGQPLGDLGVYGRIQTPKNGRRTIGAVAFVVTDLEHSTAMSNTDGVAFRELQILHDNVRAYKHYSVLHVHRHSCCATISSGLVATRCRRRETALSSRLPASSRQSTFVQRRSTTCCTCSGRLACSSCPAAGRYVGALCHQSSENTTTCRCTRMAICCSTAQECAWACTGPWKAPSPLVNMVRQRGHTNDQCIACVLH